MKLTFPGTRSSCTATSPRHARHSVLLLESDTTRILLDCGSDWSDAEAELFPDAPNAPDTIILTHAHDDHVGGLENGTNLEVWATEKTWERLSTNLFPNGRTTPLETTFTIGDLTLEAVPIAHSHRAPAVGYRITHNETTIFYCPDVAAITDPATTLRDVDLYIGDGSCHQKALLRVEKGALCGHAPIIDQLGWCAAAVIPHTIFTHFGEELINHNEDEIISALSEYGLHFNLQVNFAHDGMTLIV